MSNNDIKWHPAFAAAIKLELKEYEDFLEYTTEHELTQEPLKIDIIVVKKLYDVIIEKSIGRILKKYNIFEYKSPTDYISIDDYYKVKAYAYLYKALEGNTNSIELNEMTITLTSTSKPKKLLKYLENNNIEVLESSKGIYYFKNTDIDTQLIVTKELSDEDVRYLNLLQIEHENRRVIKNWILEYSQNIKDPMYNIIMDILRKSNPDELLEVYKSMGIPKISEENRAFLMESIRELEIDKELIEKAKEEWKSENKAEAKAEILIKQLMVKFKKLPNHYKEQILTLPQDTIELIAMEIFDLNSVEDLDQYI